MTKTLMELKAELETVSAAANKAILSDSFKQIAQAKAAVAEALKVYNSAVQEEEFNKLWAKEEPMLEAIKQLTIPTLSVSYPVDKDTAIEQAEIREAPSIINLVAFEDGAPAKISPNGQWRYFVEKFNYHMTVRACNDIRPGSGDEVKSRYKYIDAASKSVVLGEKDAIPTSTTQMEKELQTVIDSILFSANEKGENEYKVLKKDIKYILYVMCGRGRKPLTVSMPKRDTMVKLITEVLHRIVEKLEYDADYEMVKSK